MPDQDPSRDYELVDRLVEEFADRYARGQRPSVQEYCDCYPHLADLLRDLIPAVVQIEQVKEGLEVGTEHLAPPPAPPLKQLGDFHILREIGRGGMGVVYEAEQVSLGRRVALKVLTQQMLRDAKQKRRFEREAKAAARLHHTNIVPVFGTGDHAGTPYYVMQYIQGLGLDAVIEELTRMARGGASSARLATDPPARSDVSAAEVARSLMTGTVHAPTDAEPSPPNDAVTLTAAHVAAAFAADPAAVAPEVLVQPDPSGRADTSGASGVTLPGQSESAPGRKPRKLTYWQSVARVGVQIAGALDYAHKQGVIHRDVKPSNLLLDLKGTVWVTDFGLAKAEGSDNLTHTGDVLGTLRYMPPEAFDARFDARGDVYALGLTLYELAALRPAFDERNRQRLVKQVTTEDAPRLQAVRQEVPRDLATIIEKAIEKDPARRYASAAELEADLQRFVDDEPILARRMSTRERVWRWCRHHPAVASLIAFVAVLMTAITVGSLLAAGHFNRLRWNEAQAAESEREAKEEAKQAEERERKERRDAELARKAAEESKKRVEEALRKGEEHYAKARAAVNDYLTAVGEDERLQDPGFQGLRAQLLQSALGFYQDFLKDRGDDPTLRKELAHAYYRVAQISVELGQSAAARESFAQSRRLYEGLVSEDPDNTDLQDGLARCLARAGRTEQAIAIWEKIVQPDDPRYQTELAIAYNTVALSHQSSAKVKGRTPDPAKALEFHLKALTVRERMIRLRPGDPVALRDLAGTINNIAIPLTKADRREDSLALYRRAMGLAEQAYKVRPTDRTTSQFYATILMNTARQERELGRPDEVLAALRRRAEVLDRRARDHPDIPKVAAEMVAAYEILLGEFRLRGRPVEAARLARRVSERIAEVTEDGPEFFDAVLQFRKSTLTVAETPAEKEQVAAGAVAAIRGRLLASGSDRWTISASPNDPLGDRADYKLLLAQAESLNRAETAAIAVQATAEEKLAARREVLAALEAIAGPSPSGLSARRRLINARYYLGRAYLDAGRVDDARPAFDDVMAASRRLAEDHPKNEQLRIDLAAAQLTAGDAFAAAGRLAEAGRVWDEGLAVLDDAVRANPVSFPARSALATGRLRVSERYSRLGLWDLAARHSRRAFEVQPPTDFAKWDEHGVLMALTGDADSLRIIADRAAERIIANTDSDMLVLGRLLLIDPDAAARHPEAVRRVSERSTSNQDWLAWCQGLARVRLGQFEDGLKRLEAVRAGGIRSPVVALALQRLGRTDAAREALRESDLVAEQLARALAADDTLKIPENYSSDYALGLLLRREAHLVIHGKPPVDTAFDRLHRGRLLLALGQPEKADAEFAAAVTLRPDDPDVWLNRARVFARLGQRERAIADIERALRHKPADPRALVETGRAMAELGELEKADAAFARAAAIAPGEPNRFLEAGWWVVGPYPDRLDLPCPPEFNPDPSRPVPAVGRAVERKWRTVPAIPHTSNIALRDTLGDARNVTNYALALVYTDRDCTASVHLRTGDDARLWVNGRLAFDGFTAWGLQATDEVHIPVALRAGRNTLLVKTRHATTQAWCECGFDDAPARRAVNLAGMGLWAEAADALAEAGRRAPLDAFWSMTRARLLLVAGRDDEYRRLFAEMAARLDWSAGDEPHLHLISACWLPPERNPERDRWIDPQVKRAARLPKADYAHYWLGHAYYRAGRFAEAETSLRKAVELSDELYIHPLLASTLHQLGRTDEARRVLTAAEERYDKLVKEVLVAPTHRLPQLWSIQPLYLITRREAHTLIDGKDPGPDPHEGALRARGLERQEQVRKAADHFAAMVDRPPAHPRLWIDRGRRLAELARWDEAAKAFANAVEMKPKDPQVCKECGRAYAELGRWDEAATNFASALDLVPAPNAKSRAYPWLSDRGGIDDLVVRWDEVFYRVTKLRPNDAVLWARRAQHFARIGRWAETEHALGQYAELDPADGFAPVQLATLLVERGDLDGYRRLCRETVERFAEKSDPWAAATTARVLLIALPSKDDLAPLAGQLTRMVADPKSDELTYLQFQLTHALAAYRAGDANKAVKLLIDQPNSLGRNDKFDALGQVTLALARHALGQLPEARSALARAKAILTQQYPRPDIGWFHADADWADWLRCRLLVREAEKLIPDAPAAVAGWRSAAPDEGARHERKVRAERATTDYALSLLRLDVGQKTEAEAGLRSVVEERGKLAAEEPDNPENQSQLAAAHLELGKLLTDVRRLDDAAKELTAAGAIREMLALAAPQDSRRQVELAAVRRAAGVLHWKAGRHADAISASRVGIELLTAASKDKPKSTAAVAALADAEIELGNRYGELALWAEAGELLARSLRRGDGERYHWRWLRAAQAVLAAGNVDAARKLADDALLRLGIPTEPIRASAMAELLALTDRPGQNGDRLIQMAETAARQRMDVGYLRVLPGMQEYRAGRFAHAVERLEAPAIRENVWAKSFLAMGHHRLGHPEQAREWLARAADEYNAGLQKRAAKPVPAAGESWYLTVNELIFYREAHELIVGRPLPTDPLERCERARSYYRVGEPDKAESELKAAAEGRTDDPDLLGARGRVYAEAGKWDEALADINRVLTLRRPAGPDWWRTGGLDAMAIGSLSDDAFDRLAAKRPADRAVLCRRIQGLAARGRFKEAAAIQEVAVKIDPTDESAWHQLALLRLESGDVDGYRAACRELVARFASPTDPEVAERMVTTCLLVPDVVTDRELIIRWAETAMAGYEKEPTHAWLLFARVLADHRLGDPAATTDRIARQWKSTGTYNAAVRAIEAVALDRQGKHAAAVESLKAARGAAERLPRPDRGELAAVWWDLPRIHTLLGEAEEVVTGIRRGTVPSTGH